MSGKNPLGLGREPQSYEGINIIVPVSGWQLIKSKRSPTTNDKKYPIGSIWINTVLNTAFILTSAPGNWSIFGPNNAATVSGASPGPLVSNGRSGQVTFTGVSIAAAADLTLTITNSSIGRVTTQILYSLTGTTTGSALTIKSVTNAVGSSSIVVTNGTGATTSTSDLTLTYIVLN